MAFGAEQHGYDHVVIPERRDDVAWDWWTMLGSVSSSGSPGKVAPGLREAAGQALTDGVVSA